MQTRLTPGPVNSCHVGHVSPPGGRSRRVRGVQGEAAGLRPPMLQDHGRADSRQGSDLEEDPQAAAHLLQVPTLSERLSDAQVVDKLC